MAVDSRELRLSPLVVIAVAPIDPVRNFLFLYQYCRMLIKKLTILIKGEIFYIEDVVTLNMGNIGVYEGGRNSSVDLVCAYHLAVTGSNQKHNIYAFSIYSRSLFTLSGIKLIKG